MSTYIPNFISKFSGMISFTFSGFAVCLKKKILLKLSVYKFKPKLNRSKQPEKQRSVTGLSCIPANPHINDAVLRVVFKWNFQDVTGEIKLLGPDRLVDNSSFIYVSIDKLVRVVSSLACHPKLQALNSSFCAKLRQLLVGLYFATLP